MDTTANAHLIIQDTRTLLSEFIKQGKASEELTKQLNDLCGRVLACRLKRTLLPCIVKLIAAYLKWIQPDPKYRSISLEGTLLSAYLYNVSQLLNRQILFYLAHGNDGFDKDAKVHLEAHISKLLSGIKPQEFPPELLSQMFYMITRSEHAKVLKEELDSLCKKGYSVPPDAFASVLFQLSVRKSPEYFDFLHSIIQHGYDGPTCYAMTVRHCLDNLSPEQRPRSLQLAQHYEDLGFRRNVLQHPSSFKACEKILLHYISHRYFDEASKTLHKMKTFISEEALKQHHAHLEQYCLIWSSQFGQNLHSTLRFLYSLFHMNSSIHSDRQSFDTDASPEHQVRQIGLPIHRTNIPFLIYVYCRFGMAFLVPFIKLYGSEFRSAVLDRPCMLLDAALIIRNNSQILFAKFVNEEISKELNQEKRVIFSTLATGSDICKILESDPLIQELVQVWSHCHQSPTLPDDNVIRIILEPFTVSLLLARWTRMQNTTALFELFDHLAREEQWQHLLKRSTFMTLMNRFISHRDWHRVSTLLSASIQFKLTTNRVDSSLSMLFHQASYITSQILPSSLLNDPGNQHHGMVIFSDLVTVEEFLDRWEQLSFRDRADIAKFKELTMKGLQEQNIRDIKELRLAISQNAVKLDLPESFVQRLKDRIMPPKPLEDLRTSFLRNQNFHKVEMINENDDLLDSGRQINTS